MVITVTRSKEPDPTDKHVGARIRMRRMMLGISQTNLADAVDLTFQQVQKYEKGVNRVSASRMQQFAKILSVPISFFFEGSPAANVVGGKSGGAAAGMPAYIREFLAIRDGIKIIKAFSQIRNHKNQKKYTELVINLLALFDYKVDNDDHYLVIKYDKSKFQKKKSLTLTGS